MDGCTIDVWFSAMDFQYIGEEVTESDASCNVLHDE